MADENEEQLFEQWRLESLKADFEFMKHLTAFDPAAPVVIVAFSHTFGFPFAVAGMALLGFSLSLTLALIGLIDITPEIRKPPGAANRRSSTGVQYRVLPSLLFIWGLLRVAVPLVLKAA